MKFSTLLSIALVSSTTAFLTPAPLFLSSSLSAVKSVPKTKAAAPSFSMPSFGKKETVNPTKKGKAVIKKVAKIDPKKTNAKSVNAKASLPKLSMPAFGKKASPAPTKAAVPALSMPSFGNKPATPAKVTKDAPLKTTGGRLATMTLPATPSLPSLPSAPTLPALPNLFEGGVVGIAGKGMSLLGPVFSLEAKFQAGVTGFVGEIIGSPFRTNPIDVRADINDEIKRNKAVIYTYDLSPFSTQALALLAPYDVKVISMGAEWFLPGLLKGPENSERRVALEELTGSTSLPKLFVNGVSYGGFSTGGPSGGGLVALESSGALASLGLRKKPVTKGKK